ncbi:MAG: PrsW family intramembrane metalloprotease [Chloroflexi bacterium]|nr:PrsW family intramembrane metalloprotease [Chloroflexota bacterium]
MRDFQLLAPAEAGEEPFPYRRVWRTLILELAVLGGAVIFVIMATRLGLVADTYSRTLSSGLALLPIVVFLFFSVRRERRVLEPRQGLIAILFLSMVIANGLAVPVINEVFTPERWLPGAGFFNRILGYAFTIGILSEFIKYAVVRYTMWPSRFRIRLDGIAYSTAAALGFATVLNLRLVLYDELTLSSAAINILTNVYIHIAIAAVMGYFLGELAIGNPSAMWLPIGLFVAAMLSGIHFAFRGIAIASGLGSRAIGGLFLVIGLTAAILGVLSFIIESADARMADKLGVRRIR